MPVRQTGSSLLRIRDVLIIFFSLSGLAAALRTLFFRIDTINMLTYKINLAPDCFPVWWCLLCGMPALLLLNRSLLSDSVIRKTASSVMPFLAGFFLPHDRFIFFPVFFIMLGWGIARSVRASCGCFCWKYLKSESSRQILVYKIILGVGYVLMTGWGYFLQLKSSKNLYINYWDWGVYVESYLRLASGTACWKEWFSTGLHWNPLVNVISAGFVWLFPYEEAFFLFNSILIYSVIPLLWQFGRALQLKPFHCFCLALAAAFCPVYGNLSLCVYYGFHPIYYCIPLLLLFFIFRETGNRTGMVLCLAATLLVKETMMIFWFGYGIWRLCRRRWLSGTLFAVGGLAGFGVLSIWVIPWLADWNVYPQASFLYSTLGNSMAELIMSPFLRPAAFWNVCFQWQNFAFLATLLIPFFFCIWLFPDMMIALLPLLAGICLRSSPEVKNIALWYGLEATTMLAALTVINCNRIRMGEKSVWTRIVFWRQHGECSRNLQLTSLLIAVLAVNIAAHYCFAMTLWGKYNFRPVMNMPDGSEIVMAIREKLPPRARVLATERLRNHFMYQHPTVDFGSPRKVGDYLVLALHDRSIDTAEKLEKIRREIASDPKIIPVDSFNLSNRFIVVFAVSDGKVTSAIPRLRQISASEFAKIGVPFPNKNSDIRIRYLFQNDRHIFLIRLEKTLDYDFDFVYSVSGPWGRIRKSCVFGWGLYPAYSCPAGTLFIVEQNAPQAASVNCFCLERPASRLVR